MNKGSSKEFDIVIWGATGFTGRLVVEYLFKRYGVGKELKWAIAGRNQGKLKSIRASVADDNVPMIIADSQDRASLDILAKKTRVVCTTVGPYAKYGSELVAACVENGSDYCDLTGEVQWMRKMIDLHHQQAKDNGVRIVHTCGFDSIPSDMGVFFLQRELLVKTGEYARHVKLRVKAVKGGLSGGTYASLNNVMAEAAKDPSIMDILNHPYGLNPGDEMEGPDGRDLRSVVFDKDVGGWISPFIMSVINTKVVRRSQALSGYPYGKDFMYDEAILTGPGLGGRMKGVGSALALGALAAGKPGGIYKKMLNRIMPKPGEGPSPKERESGFFNLQLTGIMADGSKHRAKVKGDRDPGYGSTSKMLGESAVCLAKDRDKTPESAGVLTPSTAMGSALVDRLQANAGLTFEMME